MTLLSGESVQPRSPALRLRLGVFLTSLPFGMLLFGLPLIAREWGPAPSRSAGC